MWSKPGDPDRRHPGLGDGDRIVNQRFRRHEFHLKSRSRVWNVSVAAADSTAGSLGNSLPKNSLCVSGKRSHAEAQPHRYRCKQAIHIRFRSDPSDFVESK